MKILGLVILIILALVIVPTLFIAIINGLAESGGAEFHLDYTVWNFLLTFALLVFVRGDKSK